MSIVYFTSINNLKERTTINLNVEDKILESSVLDAQDIDIQPILGTRLFNAIKTKIIGNILVGDYKTLMDDYIEPCLIKFAQRRSLIFMYSKLNNKSITIQESTSSTPVELDVLDKVRRELLDDAEFYSNRLKDYLCNYSTLYPEYTLSTKDEMDANTDESYFSGIYLDSREDRNIDNIYYYLGRDAK